MDVVFEAAWGGSQHRAGGRKMARLGGRLVLVGIPSDDQDWHESTRRRGGKGLTILMSRRMKHTIPRARFGW